MKGKLVVLLACFCVLATAQKTNPFDLVPRMDTLVQEQAEAMEDAQQETISNPFDIVDPPKGRAGQRPVISPASQPDQSDDQPSPDRVFLIIISIIDFVLLTMLVILFRNYFDRVYNGFLNDNLLGQLYRERSAGFGIPFLVMYSLYFLNLGWLIFLTIKHYKFHFVDSNTNFLLMTIGLVILATVCRHIVLSFVAFAFPVTKEAKLYSFLINIFNIIVGLALLPINLFIAVGPPNLSIGFIFFGFVVVILIYLFRSIRGLLIANRYLTFYKFHFLLYICTVEIAPLLVLYKLISIYLQE